MNILSLYFVDTTLGSFTQAQLGEHLLGAGDRFKIFFTQRHASGLSVMCGSNQKIALVNCHLRAWMGKGLAPDRSSIHHVISQPELLLTAEKKERV